MSFSLVGHVWDPEGFRSYLEGVDVSWAEGVTLHHTAAPSLEQRPKGFTVQHMRNLAHYYRNERRWDRGPHLFVDDDQIFGLSPLTERGIHAKSFNRTHIGVEVLGNYDTSDPAGERGLACWRTAGAAVSALLDRMGRGAASVNFHRDDPKTNKSCPGRLVTREFVESLLEEPGREGDPEIDVEEIRGRIAAIEWQLGKIKELL